jgi:chemotaxis protein methyltransferase CheR
VGAPGAATPAGSVAPASRAWDLGLVLEAMRQERFAEALELLGALPPGAAEEPDALLLRAVLLTNGGRREEAERACARLLALDELNAGAHYVMALCREHAGDPRGASEHDQAAAYLDPGFAMPHVHLGLAARRAGDAEGAARELGRAVALLAQEDAARLLLFGGGFTRDTLLQLCRAELVIARGQGRGAP